MSHETTVVITKGGTVYTTKSLQPTTVPISKTTIVTAPSTTITEVTTPVSSTTPAVTAGATTQQSPAIAFLAGLFGLMALF